MFKTNLIFTFGILFSLAVQFQTLHANNKLKIHHQPPPNQLDLKDLWNLDITNTTRENITTYLRGFATESVKGLIVYGKSQALTLRPGMKKYEIEA